MRHVGVAFAVLLSSAALDGNAQVQCERGVRPVTELGSFVSDPERFSDQRRTITVLGRDNFTRYLRVRLKADAADGECDWMITVRDAQWRAIQTLTRKDFANSGELWTARVYNYEPNRPARAYLDLDGCDGATPNAGMLEFIELPTTTLTPFYSAKDAAHPRYVDLHRDGVDTAIARLGDSVGLFVSSWTGEPPWACSGVMIADDLFLTNWHCGGPDDPHFAEAGFWNPIILRDSFIDLSWDGDSVSREYLVAGLVASNLKRDYAILRLHPAGGVGKSRIARLGLDAAPNAASLIVIHHPEARVKQVTTGCGIVSSQYPSWKDAALITDFTHDCDTEGGSSGGPIFNQQGELIGIQHLGYDRAPNCTVLAGGEVNKAVRIEAILDDLRCEHRDVVKRLVPNSHLARRDTQAPCMH